jgi:GTP cyclohydrolase I
MKKNRLRLHGAGEAEGPRLSRRYDARFRASAVYRAGLPDLMDAGHTALGARVVLPQVGVTGFRLPLKFKEAGGAVRELEARVSGTVSLAANLKGINMSRILRDFQGHGAKVFTLERLGLALSSCRRQLAASAARVRVEFNFPIRQRALRSGLEGWQYYAVAMEGALDAAGVFRRFLELEFVYSSACPCSAELAEHAREERGVYAVGHSQRSKARIRVEVAKGRRLRVEDLRRHCLAALKTETQVMVKREDEQAFAELNGAELKFVEDAARLLHSRLEADARIADFRVVCLHFESLHSHDAVAVTCKGLPEGMTADSMDFRSATPG